MAWYEEQNVDGEITQGEIILNCPIILPHPENDFSKIYELEQIKSIIYFEDVVVLNQACDLANAPFPENLILCRMQDIKGTGKDKLNSMNSNRMPRYHLISKKDFGVVKFNYQIVDFGDVYYVPIQIVQEAIRRQEKRVLLNSPYREFLSQRFGNFYSRIGLPNNIDVDDLAESRK